MPLKSACRYRQRNAFAAMHGLCFAPGRSSYIMLAAPLAYAVLFSREDKTSWPWLLFCHLRSQR